MRARVTKRRKKYEGITHEIYFHRFGESAPGEEVMKEFGFTVENIIRRTKKLLQA